MSSQVIWFIINTMKIKNMDFSQQLRQLRFRAGLSMRQLAELAGISEAYVSLLEAAKRVPSEKLARKLTDILAQDGSERSQLLSAAGMEASHEQIVKLQPVTGTSSAFEHLLFEVHLELLARQQQSAQQRLTEALPQFHQPIQLQILIAFLEAARGQWILAARALDTAQQAFAFCPDDLSAQTLLRAQGLMASLTRLADTDRESLRAFIDQLADLEDLLLRAYLTVAGSSRLVEIEPVPKRQRELAQACEALLALPESLTESLLQWAYDHWLTALTHSVQTDDLLQARHLNRLALLQTPERAALWFRQSQICQALYQLTDQAAWQAESWQSLQTGLQKDPAARLETITRDWTLPIRNAQQLFELTQPAPSQS